MVEHIHADTLDNEVQAVVEQVQSLKAQTECGWNDIAILVRANDQAIPFLTAFEQAGIPYTFMTMRGLYRKPSVLDAVALLRVIDDPNDSPSTYRILSHPHVGLPQPDVTALAHQAKKTGESLLHALESGEVTLSSEGRVRADEWLALLADLRERSRRRNALEMLAAALKESGLYGAVLQLSEEQQLEQSNYLQQFYEPVSIRSCKSLNRNGARGKRVDWRPICSPGQMKCT